jgi:hypothetical protein
MIHRIRFAAWLSLAIWVGAIPAFADDAADRAAAEALFAEGRRLLAAGDHAAACPKFEASNRLDPGAGTLLNLGDCYEKSGRTASGWAAFREAVAVAHRVGDSPREQLARDRAARLEPLLFRLSIVLADRSADDIAVALDGKAVDRAVLGTPTPIDPGRHVVVASAPAKKSWTKAVDIGGEGKAVVVTVPTLDNDTAAVAGSVTPGQPPAEAPPPAATGSNKQRAIGLTIAGVGAAGLVAGTVFGLVATSKWHEAKDNCPGNVCTDPHWLDVRQQANTQADASTILFAVGGAALATGAVLWLTAPRAPKAPAVGGRSPAAHQAVWISPNGVAFAGTF